MNLDCEVIIDKPIQEVWDYANNPDNLTKWLNDFIRYKQLTGDVNAPKIGDTSEHTYSQSGGEFTMLEEITAYDPPTQVKLFICLLYTSPSPRDGLLSRMPSSA